MENILAPQQASPDIWVIRCRNYVDAYNSPLFDHYIQDLIKNGRVRIVADFSELEYLASTGCNVLLGNLSAARRKGGDIIVMKAGPAIIEVFDLLGVSDMINIVPDVDAAAEFFRKQTKAIESGELKVADLVAKAGGEPEKSDQKPLVGQAEWDGAKVPDPIDDESYRKKGRKRSRRNKDAGADEKKNNA